MSAWILKQWPVPLVAAAALIAMLAAQRFGVTIGHPIADRDRTPAAEFQCVDAARVAAVR